MWGVNDDALSEMRGVSSSRGEGGVDVVGDVAVELITPKPGVRGVFGVTGGWVLLSEVEVLRRQERARTPLRRITVPRAIYWVESALFEFRRKEVKTYQARVKECQSIGLVEVNQTI